MFLSPVITYIVSAMCGCGSCMCISLKDICGCDMEVRGTSRKQALCAECHPSPETSEEPRRQRNMRRIRTKCLFGILQRKDSSKSSLKLKEKPREYIQNTSVFQDIRGWLLI